MVARLRLVSILEAVSYLVLLTATVVKYTADQEAGVTVMGPVHGILYLVFAGLVLMDRDELGWPGTRVLGALVLGAVPFGGFYIERNWLREEPVAERV